MIEYILLVLMVIIFVLLYRKVWLENERFKLEVAELKSSKQSLSSKYGRMTEQFMPFLESYPYNEQDFRFLGTPIDGVQFERDRIILVEFKTGGSKLTARQKEIKGLVGKGKVSFEEIRISEGKNKQ